MPKTCFVIGPIGDVRDPIRIAADAFIEFIVEPALSRREFGYSMPV